MSQPPTTDSPILLFDGVCNLCNGWVRFLMAHERSEQLRFAPLESDVGRELLTGVGLLEGRPDSLVFLEAGRVYVESDAALRLAPYLKPPWSWVGGFRLLPQGLRDGLYRWVARNRYRWFGRFDTCPVPTPSQQARFLG